MKNKIFKNIIEEIEKNEILSKEVFIFISNMNSLMHSITLEYLKDHINTNDFNSIEERDKYLENLIDNLFIYKKYFYKIRLFYKKNEKVVIFLGEKSENETLSNFAKRIAKNILLIDNFTLDNLIYSEYVYIKAPENPFMPIDPSEPFTIHQYLNKIKKYEKQMKINPSRLEKYKNISDIKAERNKETAIINECFYITYSEYKNAKNNNERIKILLNNSIFINKDNIENSIHIPFKIIKQLNN